MNKLEDQIEALVDANTACDVLDALCNVCHAKSEHIASNWQDKALARLWHLVAVKIMNLADTLERSGNGVGRRIKHTA